MDTRQVKDETVSTAILALLNGEIWSRKQP